MDPVSILGDIGQILDFIGSVLSYATDVQNADREHHDFFQKAQSIQRLLEDLQLLAQKAKEQDIRLAPLDGLGVKGGALDQLEETLRWLNKELRPRSKMKALFWTLDKGKVEKAFIKVQRLQQQVTNALERGT